MTEAPPRGPDDLVYIPASNYSIHVEVLLPTTVEIDRPLYFSAQRHSGPWTRVKFSEVPAGTKWYDVAPPSKEDEVADNLSWITDPPNAIRLEPATIESTMSGVHTRTGVFVRSGRIKVWALNAFPTDVKAGPIIVNVVNAR